MFVNAIEKVSQYTRPIHVISRLYRSEKVIPSAATLFFVNEDACAITCKHVAAIIAQAGAVNGNYSRFSRDRESLPISKKYNKRLRELEKKYQYDEKVTVQIRNLFVDCADFKGFEIKVHPLYDLAIIKFNNYTKKGYKNYAVFLKDDKEIFQGKNLCRLGYPFPEFSNYAFDKNKDDISWTREGRQGTPRFPIDGMVTRQVLESSGKMIGIELSTPGLKGQSGGPLFNSSGIVYGMQSMTHHLHLGFDIKEQEIFDGNEKKMVSNYPFLHLGVCISAGIIKTFLSKNNVKFYEE